MQLGVWHHCVIRDMCPSLMISSRSSSSISPLVYWILHTALRASVISKHISFSVQAGAMPCSMQQVYWLDQMLRSLGVHQVWFTSANCGLKVLFRLKMRR